MSDFEPESASAKDVPDLGPLTLAQEGGCWRFTLTAPSEMMLELPPDYQSFLSQRLEPLFGAGAGPVVEMDLEGLPAISSRQLGLMLALQKTLAGRYDRLRVTGTSSGVRRLLDLTRTAQFFELD